MSLQELNTENLINENELDLHPISQCIRNRKSTYAYSFIKKKIPKTTIEEIITNALWAPTHKMTQPWRFEILEGNHRQDLGTYMLNFYKQKLSKERFPESRYSETLEYPKNATLVAIVFQRNKRAQIPEWEEIAAISCAVQNMWLSCTAMEIGCYWDTGEATIQYCTENLTLKDNEKSLGIFYMGIPDIKDKDQNRKRKPLEKKLFWNIKK
ncbi:nitroreductase [Aquimarina sp. 2201CG5-10]|uniref:nitroreductase family protein n=1 Tax=Aquimarina callyspongiae TaxID=3098150 RepID=UPI002AB4A7C7|nr:nitroreductase [Aquimarina sp. 2201CG5-10]MDY8135934.1 nitroreductase [Aquimarina sp. 2201CG5-10]